MTESYSGAALFYNSSAADVGHEFDGNEHELRQRGGESNLYEADVEEVDYCNLDASQRPLPAKPAIYEVLAIQK